MRRLWVLAALALAINTGCDSLPDPDPAVASYAAELTLCVEKSNTIQEYRTCRDKVETKYASLKDGGQ